MFECSWLQGKNLQHFFVRYAKDFTDADMTTKSISSFPDASSVSSWAKTAMKWAGMITGNDAGKLNPQGTAYRIYATKIFAKFDSVYNTDKFFIGVGACNWGPRAAQRSEHGWGEEEHLKWALHCFKFKLITQNNARPRNVRRRGDWSL